MLKYYNNYCQKREIMAMAHIYLTVLIVVVEGVWSSERLFLLSIFCFPSLP